MKPPGYLRLARLQLGPGQEWVDETPAWRFVRLHYGEAYWLDRSKPRSLSPAELLIIAPNLKGNIRASQLGEVLIDWFLFSPELLCGFFTLTERQLLETGPQQNVEPVQFLPSTHPLSQSLATLVEQSADDHELIQRSELLALALRLLLGSLPVFKQPLDHGAAAQERFLHIITGMPDMELIRHSTEQLARLCGCTSRHFNRLFRQQFGESPRARQTELRLLKARSLLEASDEQVTRIAADCGYQSLSLFNSLFKRRFGMTPSEWRLKAARRSP